MRIVKMVWRDEGCRPLRRRLRKPQDSIERSNPGKARKRLSL